MRRGSLRWRLSYMLAAMSTPAPTLPLSLQGEGIDYAVRKVDAAAQATGGPSPWTLGLTRQK